MAAILQRVKVDVASFRVQVRVLFRQEAVLHHFDGKQIRQDDSNRSKVRFEKEESRSQENTIRQSQLQGK